MNDIDSLQLAITGAADELERASHAYTDASEAVSVVCKALVAAEEACHRSPSGETWAAVLEARAERDRVRFHYDGAYARQNAAKVALEDAQQAVRVERHRRIVATCDRRAFLARVGPALRELAAHRVAAERAIDVVLAAAEEHRRAAEAVGFPGEAFAPVADAVLHLAGRVVADAARAASVPDGPSRVRPIGFASSPHDTPLAPEIEREIIAPLAAEAARTPVEASPA